MGESEIDEAEGEEDDPEDRINYNEANQANNDSDDSSSEEEDIIANAMNKKKEKI